MEASLSAVAFMLAGCAEENPDPTPDTAGAFLLDAPWQYESTSLLTSGAETVPFPTDRALVANASASNEAAPAGDPLHGSSFMFGADGRLLVKPTSEADYQDVGARYSVVDASVMRAKLGESLWFDWGYHYDHASRVLLLDPEPDAGTDVLGFECDAIITDLASGVADGAGARLARTLTSDPRVETAVLDLLADAVNGALPTVPAGDADAAAHWLFGILSASKILDSDQAAATLVERLKPVMAGLEDVERAKLADELVAGVLAATVLDPALASDSGETAVRFALYRTILTSPKNLAAIERIEIELDRAEGP